MKLRRWTLSYSSFLLLGFLGGTSAYATSTEIDGDITASSLTVTGPVTMSSVTVATTLTVSNLLTVGASGVLSASSGTITNFTATNIAGITGAWTAYTPTFAGFSTAPTMSCAYKTIGKVCFVRCLANSAGTSNATTFTATLPLAATVAQQKGMGAYQDNGVAGTGPAMLQTRGASNVCDVYPNWTFAGWVATGTKYLVDFVITYETQ